MYKYTYKSRLIRVHNCRAQRTAQVLEHVVDLDQRRVTIMSKHKPAAVNVWVDGTVHDKCSAK